MAEQVKFKPGMTNDELVAAGYKYGGSSHCRGTRCQKLIEWWITPKNMKLCLDPDTHIAHWGTCVERNRFKRLDKRP